MKGIRNKSNYFSCHKKFALGVIKTSTCFVMCWRGESLGVIYQPVMTGYHVNIVEILEMFHVIVDACLSVHVLYLCAQTVLHLCIHGTKKENKDTYSLI